MVPVIIFLGYPGITASAIAMVLTIVGFAKCHGGKTGGKVAYIGILPTSTPLKERFSLTKVCYMWFFWPRLNDKYWGLRRNSLKSRKNTSEAKNRSPSLL